LVAQGTTYTDGGQSILVDAASVSSTGAISTTANSNESGLFFVTTKDNNNGTGIAPFNPNENGASSAFTSQDGINNCTGAVNCAIQGVAADDNILLLQLGTGVTTGETLNFVLQGPTGDDVSVFTSASSPSNLSSMTALTNPTTHISSATSPIGNGVITTTNTATVFSITAVAGEFIAIEADCHYLLLDSITGLSATPEPRFYGMLLAGFMIVALVYGRRKALNSDNN
jgi:hypothetical protein